MRKLPTVDNMHKAMKGLLKQAPVTCANPACANLAGASELDLVEAAAGSAAKTCRRCKVARYCCGLCALTHWRNGHEQECAAMAAGAT